MDLQLLSPLDPPMALTPAHIKLLEFAAFGFTAGIIGTMARERKLTLPRIYKIKELDGGTETVIDPGFLAAPVLGAALAMIVDGRPETALAYGLAAGFVGPSLLQSLLEPVLRKFGIDLTHADPAGTPESPVTPETSDPPAPLPDR
jgi:hypothetical protein